MGPRSVNTNLGSGSVNTNWGPGPVNTNWEPEPEVGAGGQAKGRGLGIQTPKIKRKKKINFVIFPVAQVFRQFSAQSVVDVAR